MFTALKPTPQRYKNGARVRKSRSYANQETASVYVVECPAAQCVKVGYSASPTGRMQKLKFEAGHPVFLRWHGKTTRENARAIEQAFHEANKRAKSHAVGEWYKRSGEATIAEIVNIAERLGIPLEHRGNIATLNGADKHEAEAMAIGRIRPMHTLIHLPYDTR